MQWPDVFWGFHAHQSCFCPQEEVAGQVEHTSLHEIDRDIEISYQKPPEAPSLLRWRLVKNGWDTRKLNHNLCGERRACLLRLHLLAWLLAWPRAGLEHACSCKSEHKNTELNVIEWRNEKGKEINEMDSKWRNNSIENDSFEKGVQQLVVVLCYHSAQQWVILLDISSC